MGTPKPEKTTNARFYLEKWAKDRSENWLSFLCDKIIDARKPLNEHGLEEVYELCLVENGLRKKDPSYEVPDKKGERQEQSSGKDKKFSSVKLLSLTHIEGANALKEGESIKFHPKLTVFFGHNGAGKSGYTRILKRASGSSIAQEIWSNVRLKKEKNKCKAEFKIEVNGKAMEFNWREGEQIAPLRMIKIFDGKSIPIYLNDKIKFSLSPYGLNLFSFITDAFLVIKQKLEVEINARKTENKLLSHFNEGTDVSKFISEISSDTDESEITKLVGKISETSEKLDQRREEYRRILNLGQNLEILRNRERLLSRLNQFLLRINSGLKKERIEKYKADIEKWKEKEKEVQRKSLSDFSKYGVSGVDSASWREFISSAEKYIKSMQKESYPSLDDKCVFCNQVLSLEAVNLIQLYRDFMDGTSEIIMRQILSEQRENRKEIENISNNHFSEDEEEIEKILGKELKNQIFNFIEKIEHFATEIINGISEKNLEKNKECVNPDLEKEIWAIRNKLQKEIKDAEADSKKVNEKCQQLLADIKNLADKVKLDEHKKEVQGYIEDLKWIRKAESLVTKLNTKPITDLQKKAGKKLISENFENRFKEECEKLLAPKVELSFPAQHGVQQRAKSFEGLRNIDEFLSEGEQHAVALADLFAEIRTDKENAPIVLDDPVSSMDEIRRGKLAQRITEESQKRQVIVFTHDLLFLSYIYDQVEKGEKIDSDIVAFHWIECEKNICGIVNDNSCPRFARLSRIRKEAEHLIKEVEQLKGLEKESKIKECYSAMRAMLECIVVEKFFKKVVERWNERIQIGNLERIELNKEKYDIVLRLFGEFSRYIDGHSHSATAMQDFPNVDKLKADFKTIIGLYK